MTHSIDKDLINICKQIVNEGKSEADWALIESDDMFQMGKYEGGFDADEEEFCFSVYLDEGEYWFQISLVQVVSIASGALKTIEVIPAE